MGQYHVMNNNTMNIFAVFHGRLHQYFVIAIFARLSDTPDVLIFFSSTIILLANTDWFAGFRWQYFIGNVTFFHLSWSHHCQWSSSPSISISTSITPPSIVTTDGCHDFCSGRHFWWWMPPLAACHFCELTLSLSRLRHQYCHSWRLVYQMNNTGHRHVNIVSVYWSLQWISMSVSLLTGPFSRQ